MHKKGWKTSIYITYSNKRGYNRNWEWKFVTSRMQTLLRHPLRRFTQYNEKWQTNLINQPNIQFKYLSHLSTFFSPFFTTPMLTRIYMENRKGIAWEWILSEYFARILFPYDITLIIAWLRMGRPGLVVGLQMNNFHCFVQLFN